MVVPATSVTETLRAAQTHLINCSGGSTSKEQDDLFAKKDKVKKPKREKTREKKRKR